MRYFSFNIGFLPISLSIHFPDKLAQHTMVVPSLTLDQAILASVKGAMPYEARMLCLLMLLRMPLTKIVYVTGTPLAECIIDYHLHMLPGITGYHASRRLCLLTCYDASPIALTQKIPVRPRLLHRIKSEIGDVSSAHLTCFTSTPLEKTQAVALGLLLFGTAPAMLCQGSRSGGRKLFKACAVQHPHGFEDLHRPHYSSKALADLKMDLKLRKAVVKMNDGFNGNGNAIYQFDSHPNALHDPGTILERLHDSIVPVSPKLTDGSFPHQFNAMTGLVEILVEGTTKTSPSVQCIINPNGLGIGEVGAFKEQMFNLAKMLIEAPMLKISTSAPILPIPCYAFALS
jgi:hypothetical protein